MPSDRFSNGPGTSGYIVRTNVRPPQKPYVAGAFSNQLTDKERIARLTKTAAGFGGGSAFGSFGSNTTLSSQGNFFSPQLSTDFLELPQTLREKREIYRHFYNTDEIVGQAIDLHTELPLSKLRLATPKPIHCPEGFESPEDYGKYILDFFQKVCKKTKLFQRLITAVHHYWLDGTCLPPDEWVSVDGGHKRAEDVEVGDRVLTHQGHWKPVTAVVTLPASSLIHLDVARLPECLRLTPEHPVEVLKGDHPEFIPAGETQSGDYVRVTWPTEVVDCDQVDLLEEVPASVSPVDGGYVVRRDQVRQRTKEAARVRDHLLTWLQSLKEPILRSREDILADIPGSPSFYTLNNVILTLDEELPFPFRERIATGPKDGPHTRWLPIPASQIQSHNEYTISRDWKFEAVTTLPVNDDLLYVLGYWLGDGTLTRDVTRTTEWGRGRWSICGGDASEEYLCRVEDCLGRLLGKESVVRSLQEANREPLHVLTVRGNPAFVEWWATNFGETSHGNNPKRVPTWILALPESKQLSILAGLIDSDGCVRRTHVGGVQIGLTSINVVSAARDIMLRAGAVPRLSKGGREVGEYVWFRDRWVRTNYPSHTLVVDQEIDARKLASKSCKRGRLDDAPRYTEPENTNTYLYKDGNLYFKVVHVEEKPFNGSVYNFQVSEDSSFRVRYVSTHNCAIFAEDSTVDVPPEIGLERIVQKKAILQDDGTPSEIEEESWQPRPDQESLELEHYTKNYMGWNQIIILPIDKVKISTFSFTDKTRVELIPSDRDRALVQRALTGDPVAEEMIEEIPEEVRQHISEGRLIPLGTDPDEGSFVYLLHGRKGADQEIGQSILDRCHIAGTPILVKRDDIIQQVRIEDLDPDTDYVLSHAGEWREFEIGVRHISEDISLLKVAKTDPPVGCTQDHKHPVLRGGQVLELSAKDMQPGDYVQIAQVPLLNSLEEVDLAEFMHGIQDRYKARKSGGESVLHIEVVDQTTHNFTVQYTKEQTDPRRLGRTHDLNEILKWAETLTAPVAMRSAEACERFQLHPVTLKEIRRQLVVLGYGITLTKGKTIIFPPNTSGIRASTCTEQKKSFPRHLSLNANVGYFLGFWLGDGHITKQSGLDYGVLGLTYGPNEPKSVESIERQIKPALDQLGVAWSESLTGAGTHIFGYQDALVRWLAMNFGCTSEDKHLPSWIFTANKEFLFGLLRGFCDSDGDVARKKDGSISVRFNNSNPTLMEQVFLLCTSLGIPVSKTKPLKERWVKQATGEMSWAKPAYSVHFTHGPSVKSFFESGFLAKRQDPDNWKDGRSGSRHVIHDGKLYYRVSSVSSAAHNGPVYSLNVHDDHTFFAGNFNTFNCLRTLYFREKLRQAQTSIASRAMTPKRIVWAEGLSDVDTDALREQVDLALVDPDYSIVANYQVNWEEMGARDRLLDLQVEYEQAERRLLTGLGVTESLMSGEALYSGDRLKLEVINNRYILLREILQEYVEEYLFRPVARRKGFVEKDKWGNEVVLYPRLSFTRLPLRDSQDTFDAMYNLYQKGSLSIDIILEMLNIDPSDTRMKIEHDLFTVNDATFNEILRSLYSEIGRMLAEKTDIIDKVSKYLHLEMKKEPEGEGGGGRF